MSQINKIIIVGRLVCDPKRVITRSGTPMGTFTLASNRYYNDKQGQRQEEVAFVPCVVFGAPVAWLLDHKKGEKVMVEGRLRTDSWEGPDGQASKLVLVVENIDFEQHTRKPLSSLPTTSADAGRNGSEKAPF
jgi:single-strand DNA-binding protein